MRSKVICEAYKFSRELVTGFKDCHNVKSVGKAILEMSEGYNMSEKNKIFFFT